MTIKRHDRVCGQLHFTMCNKIGVKWENRDWYEHVPKLVETRHETKVTTLWKKQVKAHRTIRNIESNITIGLMRM